MAKVTDYYCKECTQHNNGWCPHLKKNGLKSITKNLCEAGGGKRTLLGEDYIAPVKEAEEDDIISKAKSKIFGTTNEDRRKEILDILKDSLHLESDTRAGLTPGSKIVTITAYLDDDAVTDTDFYVKE